MVQTPKKRLVDANAWVLVLPVSHTGSGTSLRSPELRSPGPSRTMVPLCGLPHSVAGFISANECRSKGFYSVNATSS